MDRQIIELHRQIDKQNFRERDINILLDRQTESQADRQISKRTDTYRQMSRNSDKNLG